jgi:hypothetical protein
MSVENIQLNLKQKINTKRRDIRGCSLLPDGRMVLRLCFNNYFGKLLNTGGYILHTGVYLI